MLKALLEAGVRIDLVAGRGIGAVTTLFAAADAGTRLWEDDGLWAVGTPGSLYRVRLLWRALGLALVAALLALMLPVAAGLLAAVLSPIVLLVQVVAPTAGDSLASFYRDLLGRVLSPDFLSSIVPRLVTVALLAGGLALAGAWGVRVLATRSRRRARGGFWWRALGAPVDATHAVAWARGGFWSFIRGATNIAEPPPVEFSRRYAELVGEGIGQPGYRELIVTTHDLDARRDLVFALLADPYRTTFAARDDDAPGTGRESELVDLGGAGRDLVVDALAGALSVPILCEPHRATFASESAWRGETHRLCDRPGAAARLFDEVARAGATQLIVVSATAGVDGPHALTAARLALRARVGEWLASTEAAAVAEAIAAVSHRFWGVYRIAPFHNPLDPFDLRGGYDDRSDRPYAVRELLNRGYEDAYRQFIEPVVGASGETMRTARVVPETLSGDLPLQQR